MFPSNISPFLEFIFLILLFKLIIIFKIKKLKLIQLRQVVEKNTVNQQKVRQLRRATKKYKNTPIINHCCNDFRLLFGGRFPTVTLWSSYHMSGVIIMIIKNGNILLASTSQLLVQIIKFEVIIIASSNDVINSNMKNSSRDINNNRFDVRRKGFL